MTNTLRWIACLTIFAVLTVQTLRAQPVRGQLLGRWKDTTLVGSRYYDNTYNEIWGLAVNGREYAVIGSTWGTHFIDVTEPTAPTEVFRVAGAVQGDGIVHRDYHDYHCLLYAVSDEGNSTLQIMDISRLPDTVMVEYDDRTLISRAHNIFIDTTAGKLYGLLVRTKTTSAAMSIYDLENDPSHPEFIGSYHRFDDLNVGHVHDAYVRENIAYLHCGPTGFTIVDFSDPYTPKTLSTLLTDEYPFGGYNHSGWLNEDGQYYYMADENHGAPMKVLDVSDKLFPKSVTTFTGMINSPNSIPHNIIANGNYLYVSNYYDGLQVFDIRTPGTPDIAMYYPTSSEPNNKSYKGAWGVYPFLPSGNILVSDMQEGLFVIRGIDPASPSIHNCGSSATTSTKGPSVKTMDWKVRAQQNGIHVAFGPAISSVAKSLSLYSLKGQLIRYEMVPGGIGSIDLSLPLRTQDIYLMQLTLPEGKTATKKVFVGQQN